MSDMGDYPFRSDGSIYGGPANNAAKPPETSRELAGRIYATCVYGAPGTLHFKNADAAALIDAYVREREERTAALIEKWRREARIQTDDVYEYKGVNKCADELEAALTTARKHLATSQLSPREKS